MLPEGAHRSGKGNRFAVPTGIASRHAKNLSRIGRVCGWHGKPEPLRTRRFRAPTANISTRLKQPQAPGH